MGEARRRPYKRPDDGPIKTSFELCSAIRPCGQQNLHICASRLQDTFPEFFRFVRLFHGALADRCCKRLDEFGRRREDFFQRRVLSGRLRGFLQGWLWALQQVGDLDRRVIRFVDHVGQMQETQKQVTSNL